MARYIAFLSSINVGGNRLPMADLRAALEDKGFAGIETVIASGNVLIEAPAANGLEDRLAKILADRFDIASFAAVRTRDELAAVIAANPFKDGADNQVHALFLSTPVTDEAVTALIEAHQGRGRERIAPGPRVLYIDFCDGVAGSKLTNAFIERRLGCRGTARNMRSLARILAKMD